MKSNTPWENMNKKLSAKDKEMLKIIDNHENKILVSFTNPYTLNQLDLKSYGAILVAYQNNPEFQKITAQQIFGAKTINGVLPVTISDLYKFGSGINLDKINILSYSNPEKVGVDRFKLSKIDSIVEYAIENGMTPGAQVLVAKNSNIIYEKSFGKLRYNEGLKTDNQTMYDLASLTKILVTTPILIKLVDEGVIKLETKIKDIIPRYIDSNKSEITIKELLSGHASLQAWIPFYKFTLDENKKPSLDYYSYNKTKNNSLKVAPNLFLRFSVVNLYMKYMKYPMAIAAKVAKPY